MKTKQTKSKNKKIKNKKIKHESNNNLFSSKEEQIDYMYGDDTIMCQALKNCLDD